MEKSGVSTVTNSRRLILRFLVLLACTAMVVPTGALRPEAVLLDVLAKPFVPLEWASKACLRDSAVYLKELRNYTPWALQMYDASAKISPGVITGNYQQLGNYDECLRVKNEYGFVGQACSATVQFDIAKDDGKPRDLDLGDLLLNVAIASNATKWTSGSTVQYDWMWCVPSTCNHSELQEALEIALDPLKVEGRVDMVVNVAKESCRTLKTDRVNFDTTDWIYICILTVFALIIIASTLYDVTKQDYFSENRKSKKHVILTSFSLSTNFKSLLRTERDRNSIGCLDGLRYISICWIIYGHTYYIEAVGVKMDLDHVPKMHHDWSTMLVLNGNIVTDTFFLLSGILLAYTEMLKWQKNGNCQPDIFGLYVHRYLRLTPAYAMMIGFYSTLFYKIGSGPHWDAVVGSNRDFCRENWWTNLLYINNYINIPSMCMSQSWYLSTDMQLLWISPIFLYPMLKFRRSIFFWISVALGLVSSVLAPFFVTFSLKLTGTMLYYKEQMDVADVYRYVYTRVYNRAGPYIIGLGLGYLLYKTRSFRVKIPLYYVICGWFVASTAGLSAVFGPVGMYYENHVYNRVEASFYAGLHRQVFALAIAWIIFATSNGYGGIIGRFLSWRGWTPLSRLTYSAYLSHYVFLLSYSGNVRTTGNLTTMNVFYVFCGNLALTMIASTIWSLAFEMPFMILDRALLSRRRRIPPGLSSKVNQSKIFGSTDSRKEIYRPTDDIEYQGRSGDDSVYNSAVNISYRPNEDEESGSAKASSSNSQEENKPTFIYAISGSQTKNGLGLPSSSVSEKTGNYLDVAGLGKTYDEASPTNPSDVNSNSSTVRSRAFSDDLKFNVS